MKAKKSRNVFFRTFFIAVGLIILTGLTFSFPFLYKAKVIRDKSDLLETGKKHFNITWNKTEWEKKVEKESPEAYKSDLDLFIISGEELYRKLLSTFDLSSLPLINAYVNVNPKGEEEVFKDALGFERTGEIFLKQFEWGKIDVGSTFRHELVHVFVYYALEKHTPVPNWFNEGIAQYYSHGIDMGVESWNRLTGQDKDFKVEAKEVDPTTFFRLEATTELRKGKPQGERF